MGDGWVGSVICISENCRNSRFFMVRSEGLEQCLPNFFVPRHNLIVNHSQNYTRYAVHGIFLKKIGDIQFEIHWFRKMIRLGIELMSSQNKSF